MEGHQEMENIVEGHQEMGTKTPRGGERRGPKGMSWLDRELENITDGHTEGHQGRTDA